MSMYVCMYISVYTCMYISVPHVYVYLVQEIRTRCQIPGTGDIIGGCELLSVDGGSGAHILSKSSR